MSGTRKKNPKESFEALRQQHKTGKPQPAVPASLLPRSIKVRAEVFQHRKPAQHVSDRHVRELTEAAKAQGRLDALTVWWDGKHWSCIDGHHRMQAYMRAGMFQAPVPIEVFHGTPEEALVRAAGSNSKAKLQMTPAEKANAGWRLVVMAETLSKVQQAQAAGVSERLVAYMRTAVKKLTAMGISREDAAAMSWESARRQAEGEDSTEWSDEEANLRVEKMAIALRKALGPTAERQPDIFRLALETYSPGLAKALEDDYVEAYKEAQGET
jgi:ParB-like chromosome segregation protein Spo0J